MTRYTSNFTCTGQRQRVGIRGRSQGASRKGAIIVLTALMLIVMLAMISFAVDVGYMMSVRTEMQRAVDSGAMAGAGVMVDGTSLAEAEAKKFVQLNLAGAKKVANNNITVEFGQWDTTARTFTAGGNQVPSAIRVSATNPALPLFFGRALGSKQFDSKAEATVMYLPRDIVLALDYSGSMCFDSQLKSVGVLGKTQVENNLATMYAELGSPKYGTKMTWNKKISGTNITTLKTTLGLNSVAYPYPSGSWSDYIDYVINDNTLDNAGYQNNFGYMTWINYLQAQQQSAADTPTLWKTSEQPITAVKDAVDLFVSYLQENSTNDRLGFSLYTSSDSKAKLESALTTNMTSVTTLVRQRQAGHYVGGTNISDGMKTARLELQNNSRVGAKRMMVLMTDGEANLPSSGDPRQLCINEAYAAANAKIAIVAICLGTLADTSLLDEIASITGGAAFIVPGGQNIDDIEEQLKDVFAKVANTRPFKLVK